MQQNMVRAVYSAFSEGAQDAIEQAKNENKALQAERDQLMAEHFAPDFWNEAPFCPLCGGSGYVGSTMCECLQELCRQEQKKEVSILTGGKETFNQFRLEYYPDEYNSQIGTSPRKLMERNFQSIRRYALTFGPNADNLLFVGGTGLGKTFLSASIARVVADRGYSVVYETSSRLFAKLEKAKFNPTEETRKEADKLMDCDLLIVDDLGTEMPGQFVTAAFYSLLNDRMLEGKPMVISTNLNVDEISRRYSPQIASRLQGSFTLLPFVGEDIRVMKNRGL
jgi:DNA replication protein DnaC